MNKVFFLGAALIFTLDITLCAFATEQQDVIAGLNTLPLLTNKMTGDVTAAILYDPADAASSADAGEIEKIITKGIALPDGAKLSAIEISVSELGKLSRARIAFITPGLTPHFTDIARATAAASIITITTDIDCVRAAKCIIGVITKPNLTIYFSKPAADAAKIEFSQAFSMLVKQP